MEQDGKGLRYNKGKLEFGLIPVSSQEEYTKVLTYGAKKYTPYNWKKGMSWTSVINSLERHLIEIKKGNDYDEETGLLHSAHIMCNASFLTEYYKIYPQGDDRNFNFNKKIMINIEDILMDFTNYYMKKNKIDEWDFYNSDDLSFYSKFDEKNILEIPVKTKPQDLTFIPNYYVVSSNIDIELIKKWLKLNNFPPSMVLKSYGKNLQNFIKKYNPDIIIEVNYNNYIKLSKDKYCCYLYNTFYNNRYNILSHKKIYDLKKFML
jgi:hypothetical protein